MCCYSNEIGCRGNMTTFPTPISTLKPSSRIFQIFSIAVSSCHSTACPGDAVDIWKAVIPQTA